MFKAQFYHIVLFIIAIVTGLNGYSQNEDTLGRSGWEKQISREKEDFKEIFHQEINDLKTSKPNKENFFVASGYEKIPRRLFSAASSNDQSNIVLGISDPFMDSLQGLKLAKHRANLVYSTNKFPFGRIWKSKCIHESWSL